MNKNQLFITKNGGFLDKVTLKASELKLIASGDGVEVMNYSIDAGVVIQVVPADKDNTMEAFYVLEGELERRSEDSDEVLTLKTGDSFYAQNLDDNYMFKTVTDCRLLYVTSEPTFHLMGEKMREMHKLNAELEEKDPYTKGHSERVHNYSLEIAREMAFNKDQEVNIAMAALFHDVGKIDMPSEILQKGSRLTDEEYDVIKQHPTKGAELIKSVQYRDVSEIVIQHHERLNGSGYPYGLKGDEICMEAKVVAVADAYDAMVTDRPYQKGLSQIAAVAEINRCSGNLFDPEVVDAFNRYILRKDKRLN